MDLEKALGAGKPASVQKFSLYLPELDRDGAPVPEIERWIEAALWIFGEINGGATRLPVAQGYWRPSSGAPVREPTNVVYSYIRDGRFEANLDRLVRFIHSFGKHANQGEVMVEFSGEVRGRGFVSRAYFIDKYPKAGPRPF
ncbi:MAG TPA: hypothetical protein VF704_01330 [Allosphingosinicella sp.]